MTIPEKIQLIHINHATSATNDLRIIREKVNEIIDYFQEKEQKSRASIPETTVTSERVHPLLGRELRKMGDKRQCDHMENRTGDSQAVVKLTTEQAAALGFIPLGYTIQSGPSIYICSSCHKQFESEEMFLPEHGEDVCIYCRE